MAVPTGGWQNLFQPWLQMRFDTRLSQAKEQQRTKTQTKKPVLNHSQEATIQKILGSMRR